MKTKLILLIAMTIGYTAKAVDNAVVTVDIPAQTREFPVPLNGHVALRAATDIYNCYSTDAGVQNEFKLAELKDKASIHTYLGENLYGSGLLSVVSKVYGFKSVQTTYLLDTGGQLVISEYTQSGRGGRGGGRGGGRAGDFGIKIISAKLTTNEKDHYFDCY